MNAATQIRAAPFSATQLMRAVFQRDFPAVKRYIGQAGRKDADGKTALMYAATLNFTEAVQYFIASPPPMNGFRTYFEDNPVSELRMRDNEGETALHAAVRAGSSAAISILAPLEHSIRSGTNLTALMIAALLDNADAAQFLVRYEAQQESCGKTALMMAVEAMSYSVVPVLVPNEAGMFVCSNRKFGPVAAFAQLESYQPFDMVVDGKQLLAQMNAERPKSSALMLAAEAGDMLMVRFLVDRERGMQDPVTGDTALMRCLDSLAGQVYQLQKADATERDRMSTKILKLQEVALFLAQVPEETGKSDNQGKTALMRACVCRQYGVEIVSSLCSREKMHVDESGLACDDYTGTDEHMRAVILAAKGRC